MSNLSLLASGLTGDHAQHNAKLVHDLRKIAKLASRCVTTCRLLAQGLAPLRGHQDSLADALRQLASDTAGRAGGPTVLFSEAISAPSLISQEANDQLYRIAQEALNNALKHSGARVDGG